MNESPFERVYDQLDRLESRSCRNESRLTEIDKKVDTLTTHVIGTKEIPGLVPRFNEHMVVELREHGGLALIVASVGLLGVVAASWERIVRLVE